MRVTTVRRAQIDPFDPENPPSDYGLSERGRVQARLLGARLVREDPPDRVYTGDSDRHRDTAALVARTVEAVTGDRPPVETDAGLDDIAWTMDALRQCAAESLSLSEWTRLWIEGDLPVEESVTEARERVGALPDRLVGAHDPDATVLCVTSAVPVQLLACDALGSAIEETWFPVANCAVSAFDWTPDGREAATLNDTAHLPGRLVTTDGFRDRE